MLFLHSLCDTSHLSTSPTFLFINQIHPGEKKEIKPQGPIALYILLPLFLPGRGDCMIMKVVFPERRSPIELQCADPCDFPKSGKLNCTICDTDSGGLRVHSPLGKRF